MFLFNAKIQEAERLEKVLFGRRDTADWLEKIAVSFAKTGHAVHPLLIGNRGAGKSHLLKVLYNRLAALSEIRQNLVIAYLEEDPYGIETYLDLTLRIIKAIARLEADPVQKQRLQSAHQTIVKTPPPQRHSVAEGILLEHLAGRRLLILAENLSDIFAAIKENGQSRWRDFLQQHGNTMIVATSQAIFSAVQERQQPFYGFFHIQYLERLRFEEARDLMLALAEMSADPGLVEHLHTHAGEGHLRAVFDLTEGNHRLLITFFDFLKAEYKSELSRAFLHTVDKLKPYYESFLKTLAPQQQKIVHFLALERTPQSGTTIAENCFLAPTTVSKQMSELHRLGYVRSDRVGREAFYEITEPMLRMCLEANENADGILGLFVDFLGNCYSCRELKEHFLRLQIEKDLVEPELRIKLADEAYFFAKALPRYASGWQPDSGHLETLRSLSSQKERMAMIAKIVDESEGAFDHEMFFDLILKGNCNQAGIMLEEFYSGSRKKDELYWSYQGYLLFAENRFDDAEAAYRKALDIQPDFGETLSLLGLVLASKNRFAEAEAAYRKSLKYRPNLFETWHALGFLLSSEKRYVEAEESYRKAITIKANDSEVWKNFCFLLLRTLRYGEARQALQKCLTYSNERETWAFALRVYVEMADMKGVLRAINAINNNSTDIALPLLFFILCSYAEKNTVIAILQNSNFQGLLSERQGVSLPEALNQAIRYLLQQENITPTRLQNFHQVLSQLYGQRPDMHYPLLYLHVGIRHVKLHDPKALFDLTLEERRAFEQFILGKEQPTQE